MKRLLRSGIGAICAVAMAATGLGAVAQSAYADSSLTTITVKNVNEGDVFEAFRLLNVQTVPNDNGDEQYAYTLNDDYTNILMSAATKTLDSKDPLNSIVDYITSLDTVASADGSDDDMTTMATPLRTYMNKVYKLIAANESLTADVGPESATADGTGWKVEFANVPQGYYLIHQTNASEDEINQTYSLVLVDTAGKTGIEIEVKRDTPEVIIFSCDEANLNGRACWDASDNGVDEVFSIHANFALPSDIESYEQYKIILHVQADEGITITNFTSLIFSQDTASRDDYYASSIKTFLNNASLSNSLVPYQVLPADDTENILADDDSFAIVIPDLIGAAKVLGITLSTVPFMQYGFKAVLNSEANIGPAGNTVTAWAEYSSDPNQSATDTDLAMSKTATNDTVIYAYELDVNKVLGDSTEALGGAEFTLYELEKNTNGSVQVSADVWDLDTASSTLKESTTAIKGNWTVVSSSIDKDGNLVDVSNGIAAAVADGDAQALAKFIGLNDGIYKLVESVVPPGFNRASDIVFEIYADHTRMATNYPTDLTLIEDIELKSVTFTDLTANFHDTTNTSFVDSNLYVDADTSYMPFATIKQVTEPDEDSGEIALTGIGMLTVANYGGTKLPSTGGFGTVMLYTVGGLMILITIMGIAYSLRKNSSETSVS